MARFNKFTQSVLIPQLQTDHVNQLALEYVELRSDEVLNVAMEEANLQGRPVDIKELLDLGILNGFAAGLRFGLKLTANLNGVKYDGV